MKLPSLLITLFLIAATLPLFPEKEYIYPVYAEDATSSTLTTPLRPNKQKVETRINKAEDKVETKIARVEGRIAQRKETFEEKMEMRKERVATRSAAFKAKLLRFRDQVKAKRVENINDRLDKINENRTTIMLEHIEKIKDILENMEEKVDTAAEDGKDMTEALAAIEEAKAAIDAAKEAAETQQAKDYIIAVTTETTVKADSQASRDNLRNDLKAVHDLIVAARQATAKAISTGASSLKGVSSGQ